MEINIFKSFKLLFSNLLSGDGGMVSGGGTGGGGGDGGPMIPIIIGGIGLGVLMMVRGCESCRPSKSTTSYSDVKNEIYQATFYLMSFDLQYNIEDYNAITLYPWLYAIKLNIS